MEEEQQTAEEVYDQGVPMVITPYMTVFEGLVEDIRYRGQLIARNQKLDSGVSATTIAGFTLGLVFALALTLLPLVGR